MSSESLGSPKRLRVQDLCERGYCEQPTTVRPDTPFREIVQAVRQGPPLRTVVVVDGTRRVVGAITMQQLFEAIFMDLFPEAALAAVRDIESAIDVADDIVKETAADIMAKPTVVRTTDKLVTAFARMYRDRLTGIPVVDAEGLLVGYLDRLTIVTLWPDLAAAG